jgi:hypothetical protein
MKSSGPLKALLGISLVLSLQACNLPGISPTPLADSSAAAPQSLPPASGGSACSNPLYPVVKGASWTYSITGIASDTFTHSITDVRADGFTDQDLFASGVMRTGEWKCDQGALTALSPLTGPASAITANNMAATFNTTEMTGVTLPAGVKPGDTWNQDFNIEGTQSVGGQNVAATGKVGFACTAGLGESVTVTAGPFNAQRVDCTINLTVAVNIGGLQVPTSFSADTSMWYAPGVGLVRLDSAITGMGNGSIELTAYSLP